MRAWRAIAALLLALLAWQQPTAQARPADAGTRWIASWAAAAQGYGQQPAGLGLAAPAAAVLDDLSLRQRLQPSLGGARIRIRFSNRFGRQPLHIAAASVARAQDGAAVAAESLSPLRFDDGRADVTIAAGGEAWSDAADFAVAAGQAVSVSFRIDAPTPYATVHQTPPGASWMVAGDAVMRPRWEQATPSPWNHIVTGLDVAGPPAARLLVAFGDSITEGAGATEDAGRPVRYPERLGLRLQREGGRGRTFAVVNAGIGGNRLLADWVGPKAVDRFAVDALGQSGVTHVLILIGINDIGFSLPEGASGPVRGAPAAAEITKGLQRLIDQARGVGAKVLLGTLTPFKGASYWSEEKERRRQAVNDWIRGQRGPGLVVVDFDAALRNPADPQSLKPLADSGDHLHPGNAGYAAMADAVDLQALGD